MVGQVITALISDIISSDQIHFNFSFIDEEGEGSWIEWGKAAVVAVVVRRWIWCGQSRCNLFNSLFPWNRLTLPSLTLGISDSFNSKTCVNPSLSYHLSMFDICIWHVFDRAFFLFRLQSVTGERFSLEFDLPWPFWRGFLVTKTRHQNPRSHSICIRVYATHLYLVVSWISRSCCACLGQKSVSRCVFLSLLIILTLGVWFLDF